MAADEQFPHPPESPPGISLEELAAAFAQAMGGGAQTAGELAAANGGSSAAVSDGSSAARAAESSPPGRAASAGAARHKPASVRQTPGAPYGTVPAEADIALAAASDELSSSSATDDADGPDDPCPITPSSVLEAMLFVGNRDGSPLTPARAAELMRGVAPGEIAGLVDELNARYEADGRPYTIVSEGSGYRLRLRPEFAPLRNRFYGKMREVRLSQAAVDILAIVAYQQPLTAEQINKLRGKPSGHVLSQLVHRQLLRIERTGPRRTAQYYTTERFLRLFSLDSLDDLPRD